MLSIVAAGILPLTFAPVDAWPAASKNEKLLVEPIVGRGGNGGDAPYACVRPVGLSGTCV